MSPPPVVSSIQSKSMSQTIQAVRGMNDVLPDQAPLWNFFEDTARNWLAQYGYRGMRMPILERTELFVRSIGEVTDIVEKEMYTFIDQLNGESLTLRPEGTASCVRAANQHNLLYNGPQRVYYTGPMFRHERPQKGRYRQFHQIGVEALGFPGPEVDAEHMVMTARLWKLLGLDGIRLQINTLGSTACRARFRARLVKYLQGVEARLDEDSKRRLHANPLRVLDSKTPEMQDIIAQAPRMVDDLDEDSLRQFESLQGLLRGANVDFEINPRLVRGLDYYNDAVYEWTTERLGAQGTVCAGGRYDGLFGQIGGKPAPACGYAMGIERLLALIAEAGPDLPSPIPDVYLVHAGEGTVTFAWAAAEQLRDQGFKVLLHLGGGSFKSQMKRADASGARFAVIVGEDEASRGVVSIKPLRQPGEQVQAQLGEASGLLRAGT